MKFGVREICNVVFRAKTKTVIGNSTFQAGQPVLYLDSAKTSTLEGAATTVYAQGGRGNVRLIAWEGEKTLTFTVEDALISPIGFSILSGAGLIKKNDKDDLVHVHTTTRAQIVDNKIELGNAITAAGGKICGTAPIFVMGVEKDGSLDGSMYKVEDVKEDGDIILKDDTGYAKIENGAIVMVDYYVKKNGTAVSEIQIDANNFAGNYYVEAETLFRRQTDGVDAPVNITIPNVKIQSNFSFSMASTGDPSTFTFTMDALPGYTYFNPNKEVLCVMQIIEDSNKANTTWESVMDHDDGEEGEADIKLGIDDTTREPKDTDSFPSNS